MKIGKNGHQAKAIASPWTDHFAKSIAFARAITFARRPIFKSSHFLIMWCLFERFLHRTTLMFLQNGFLQVFGIFNF